MKVLGWQSRRWLGTASALALVAALGACGAALEGGAGSTPAKKKVARGEPFTFGWKPGAFSVTETAERDGELVSLTWSGNVAAKGKELEISFGEPSLDGPAEALMVGASHALFDVMPTLTVNRESGALVRVSGTGEALKALAKRNKKWPKTVLRELETAKIQELVEERAKERWGQWTSLIGFDVPKGGERTVEAEAESGEGLSIPVAIVMTHAAGDDGGSHAEVTRTFSGDAVMRTYQVILAGEGAPPNIIEAVTKVIREERIISDTDPKTLRAKKIVSKTLTTVHSGAKVELQSVADTWTFVW